MRFKVKFLEETAGRKKGQVEEFSEGSESLVREWASASLIEILDGPKAQPGRKPWEPEPQEKAPLGPPVDRAVKHAPVRKQA